MHTAFNGNGLFRFCSQSAM